MASAACQTGATTTGDKPGLLKTARIPVPSTSDASNAPARNWTCGSSACNCPSWGGASRVSATVTWAPCRTHQRAIAMPEVPSPRTRTCCPSKEGAATSSVDAVTTGAFSSLPSCTASSTDCGAASGSVADSGALTSANSCVTKASASRAAVRFSGRGRTDLPVAGACGNGSFGANSSADETGAASWAGTRAGSRPSGEGGMEPRSGMGGSLGFIAVSESTGPPDTTTW